MKISVIIIISLAMMLIASTSVASTVQAGQDLQKAIDSASSGDTIVAGPGVYDKIEISKSLNLVGQDATIRAGSTEACIRVKADAVSISGFTVREGLYGIHLNGVKGCILSNNTVVRCKQPGIALIFSHNNIIKDNNASFNGLGGEGWYGIYLSNSNDNLIISNVASHNGAYGIDLFPSCNNNTIRDNVLEGNMYGLYMFTNCSGNLIESNILSQNTNSGLDMRFNCHDNGVYNNTINNNVVVGISLLDSGNNLFRGNQIHSNQKFGIQLQGRSDDNTLTKNNISGSQTGIFVESDGNSIYGNRLADNVVQAEDRGQNRWNEAYPVGGNSWADFAGEDAMSGPYQNVTGSDGIGDVPYEIQGGARDLYPVMGERFVPIRIEQTSITPAQAVIGDDVVIQAKIMSKFGLSGVSVRARSTESEATGYVRMIPSGDTYQGTLATALFEPGRYELVLSAADRRGYELEDIIGQVELVSRQGRDFQAAMAEMGRR